MLLATGNLNKKKYAKDSVIEVDDLLESLLTTEKGKYIHSLFRKGAFEVTFPNVKLDALNDNEPIHPASLMVGVAYSIKDGNNTLSLRYCEDVTEGDYGKKIYSPDSYKLFDGRPRRVIDAEANPELALFLLMSPRCFDSPFSEPTQVVYRVHDTAKINREKTERMLRNADAIVEIREMANNNYEKLRRLAMGLRIKGAGLPSNTDWDDKNIVMAGLMEIQAAYPTEFATELKDNFTMTNGIIADSLQKGILSLSHANDLTKIVFDGNQVCEFPKQQDPVIGFSNFIINNNPQYWRDELSKRLGVETVKLKSKEKA